MSKVVYSKDEHVLESTLKKKFYKWPPEEVEKIRGKELGVHGKTRFYSREILKNYKAPKTTTKTVVLPAPFDTEKDKEIVLRFMRRYHYVLKAQLHNIWYDKEINPRTTLRKTVVTTHAKQHAAAVKESVIESRKAIRENRREKVEFAKSKIESHKEAGRTKAEKKWIRILKEKEELLKKADAVLENNRCPNLQKLSYRASGNNSMLSIVEVGKSSVTFRLKSRAGNHKDDVIFKSPRNKLFNKYYQLAKNKFSPCMIFERDGNLFIGVTFNIEVPKLPKEIHPDEVIGVDLGASLKEADNLVVMSDGDRINAVDLNNRNYVDVIEKGKNKRRRMEKLGRKTKSYESYARGNKEFHETIGKKAVDDVSKKGKKVIVLENLKGLKEGGKWQISKSVRKNLTHWSYKTLQDSMRHHARLSGIIVTTVNPAGTSQINSLGTGEGARISRREYASAPGGNRMDADVNAAQNIRIRGIQDMVNRGLIPAHLASHLANHPAAQTPGKPERSHSSGKSQ